MSFFTKKKKNNAVMENSLINIWMNRWSVLNITRIYLFIHAVVEQTQYHMYYHKYFDATYGIICTF